VGNDEVVSVEEKKEAKGVKQLKEQKKWKKKNYNTNKRRE
jgi:hypothetical protein